MSQWYYTKFGQEYGPIDSAQLKSLAQTGGLSPNDPVRQEGASAAVAAIRVKGLFPTPPATFRVASQPPQRSETYTAAAYSPSRELSPLEALANSNVQTASSQRSGQSYPSPYGRRPGKTAQSGNGGKIAIAITSGFVVIGIVVLVVVLLSGGDVGNKAADSTPTATNKTSLTDQTLARMRTLQTQANDHIKAGQFEVGISEYDQALEAGKSIYPKSQNVLAAIDDITAAKTAAERQLETKNSQEAVAQITSENNKVTDKQERIAYAGLLLWAKSVIDMKNVSASWAELKDRVDRGDMPDDPSERALMQTANREFYNAHSAASKLAHDVALDIINRCPKEVYEKVRDQLIDDPQVSNDMRNIIRQFPNL